MSNTLNTTTFHDAVLNRHSIRVLSNEPPILASQVQSVLELAQHAPSAFNMQSSRIVCLMGDDHTYLWDMVLSTLEKLKGEKLPDTEAHLQGFKNGAGTLLFFEDDLVVEQAKKDYATYADRFDKWSEQNNAILQYNTWLAFSADNIGASIQHYNPLIDEQVQTKWNIPQNYRLIAQMPFGRCNEKITPPELKPFDDIIRFL